DGWRRFFRTINVMLRSQKATRSQEMRMRAALPRPPNLRRGSTTSAEISRVPSTPTTVSIPSTGPTGIPARATTGLCSRSTPMRAVVPTHAKKLTRAHAVQGDRQHPLPLGLVDVSAGGQAGDEPQQVVGA